MQTFSFAHSCERPVNKQTNKLCSYSAGEIQDSTADELL